MTRIHLKKATRIEGSADIRIEIEEGRVSAAHFMVQDFRGFEKLMQGRRVEVIPQLSSRICGLCSASHQLANLAAIEEALGVTVLPAVAALREITLLGERIASHAVSCFLLSLPDLVEEGGGGLFDLYRTQPELTAEALRLRRAGQTIVSRVGGRAVHPVSLGLGGFATDITQDDLDKIRVAAAEALELASAFAQRAVDVYTSAPAVPFPHDAPEKLLAYNGEQFVVMDRRGAELATFGHSEFEDQIAEMRTDWSFAKTPYLTEYGFMEGTMLVGPLARRLLPNGILSVAEVAGLDLADHIASRDKVALEDHDACRLLEIISSAARVRELVDSMDLSVQNVEVDAEVSGQGIGVVEAPRGILLHSCIVGEGKLTQIRMLVATQFNNAFLNLLLKDTAQDYVDGDSITEEGERRIGRNLRLFDPCLSCATH